MMNNSLDLPNYTQFPNVFLDNWLPILPPHEFCVLSFMVRKIFGFHHQKEGDKISISQIAKGTGQTARGIINHVKNLIKRGLITRFKGKTNKGEDETNLFTINIKKQELDSLGSECHSPQVVNTTAKRVVNGIHTQKKTNTKENIQNKEAACAAVAACLKDINISKSDKEWLTKSHTEEDIAYAVKWATHPLTEITTTLQQALKWAAKTKPPLPIDAIALAEEHRKLAHSVEQRVETGQSSVISCSRHVEIIVPGCSKIAVVEYEDKNFKDKFKKALFDFKVKLRPN
jgi:DNA-binding Lrp family transcriptional regulator